MNITNSNFKCKLPEVRAAIESATFLSVDGEFTGLKSEGINWNAFDTLEERYQKIKSGSVDFLMIQFGLCAFKVGDGKVSQKTFNFYIFPHVSSIRSCNSTFICEASSLNFLASLGFDFNKLFKDGIPYLKPDAKEKLLQNVKDRQEDRKIHKTSTKIKRDCIPIPEEHKCFIERLCKQVEEFVAGDELELWLEKCNSFLRLLLFQEVGRRFNNVHLETKINDKKDKVILVTKGGEEEQQRKDEERKKLELEEVEDAEGFCKVINLISNSGKLIVGHNMLLDICHVINQFICKLPETYLEFKKMVSNTFPRILDTKWMASNYPFNEHVNDTSLDKLLSAMREEPFSIPVVEAEEESSYSVGEKLHEAGYDAYITGLVFITMLKHLGKGKQFNLKLVEPFINRLHLTMQDVPYINLRGEEVDPPRDHVFHVTFPKIWRRTELLDLFSPFGRVYIAYIDDVSAWVALVDRQQAPLVTRRLSGHSCTTVVEYNMYKGHKPTGIKRSLPMEIETQVKRRRSDNLVRKSSFEAIPEEKEEEQSDESVGGS